MKSQWWLDKLAAQCGLEREQRIVISSETGAPELLFVDGQLGTSFGFKTVQDAVAYFQSVIEKGT